MKKKEQMVYGAIERIIKRRKEAHRVPHCALRRELIDEIKDDISQYELSAILTRLVADGMLEYHPTVNDQSYYLK